MDEKLTTEEAAATLRDLGLDTTPGTLKFWRHKDRGPRYTKIGRTVRYRRGDLEDFVAEQSVEVTPTA